MAITNSSKRPATTLRCGNIKATVWREGLVLCDDLFAPIQGSVRHLAQRHLVRSQRLEALMTVAFEVKEWMTAHTRKR